MPNEQNDSRRPGRAGGGALRSEGIRYLIFGVLTTLVSLVTYFAILWGGEAAFGVGYEPDNPKYIAVYSAAKAVAWIFAVLFAFFTNKKWVFRDTVSDRAGVARQLLLFSGSRLITLLIDYFFNLAFLWVMTELSLVFLDGLLGFTLEKINDIIAIGMTQVIILVSNYFISKWLVFNKPADRRRGGGS